jgi:hypothetical protein
VAKSKKGGWKTKFEFFARRKEVEGSWHQGTQRTSHLAQLPDRWVKTPNGSFEHLIK